MMKVPGWQQALSALVEERLLRPFEWGRHDCCLFAADAVRLQTGEDPAAHLRGSYRTERGALRLLADMGGLHGVATRALGPAIPALLAQRGDVVLVRSGPVEAPTLSLGVCMGAYAQAPTLTGLQHAAMAQWVAAWRVGWEVQA